MQLDMKKMKSGILKCQFIYAGDIYLSTARRIKSKSSVEVKIWLTEQYAIPRTNESLMFSKTHWYSSVIPLSDYLIIDIYEHFNIMPAIDLLSKLESGYTRIEWDGDII